MDLLELQTLADELAEDAAIATRVPVGRSRSKTPSTTRRAGTRSSFGVSALGSFDEWLLTNEDYEFNHRVQSNGSVVVRDADVRYTYFARSTLVDLASQYFRYGHD